MKYRQINFRIIKVFHRGKTVSKCIGERKRVYVLLLLGTKNESNLSELCKSKQLAACRNMTREIYPNNQAEGYKTLRP